MDYYTDELLILLILSAGAQTNSPIDEVLFNWIPSVSPSGLVRSWPGALFTYQFLHAFLDTRSFKFPSCPPLGLIDWYENSRMAMHEAIAYASTSGVFETYGPESWGISACEGPNDKYIANGVPSLAAAGSSEADGSVAYYPMISAISYGSDLQTNAISALRRTWARGHWDARFGLPDAFHDDLAELTTNYPAGAIRTNGAWVGRSTYAIDVGPMALHLENSRSGLIWSLLGSNSNIVRGLSVITQSVCTSSFLLEGEDGLGDGAQRSRSNASHGQTIWLYANESRTVSFFSNFMANRVIQVRYSNDNFGPLETVSVYLDNALVGSFLAQDTGDSGNGWNTFQTAIVSTNSVSTGSHTIRLDIAGGDGFGVEVDYVTLTN